MLAVPLFALRDRRFAAGGAGLRDLVQDGLSSARARADPITDPLTADKPAPCLSPHVHTFYGAAASLRPLDFLRGDANAVETQEMSTTISSVLHPMIYRGKWQVLHPGHLLARSLGSGAQRAPVSKPMPFKRFPNDCKAVFWTQSKGQV